MSRRNKCGCRYSTSSDASVRKGFSLSGSLMEECAQHEAQRHNSSRLQAQQPAETACKDCNGDGKQCFAGHSAHPSNWHKCETCGGTGNAQQPAEAVHDSDCAIHDAPAYPARLCDCNASTEPAAAEYTPGDYGMEVGATTHTPAAPLPLAYVAEVVQAQPDPGLGGLRGKCLSWPKGMVNFIVESAPGTRLYTKSLASNAGVPEPRASAWRQALLGYWGLGLDDIAFLEQRALNIERMKGGGE